MPETVCGQERQQPTNPAAQQCYDEAWAWLVSMCPGCGGDAQCQSDLRALYQLMLMECNEAHSASPDETVLDAIRQLRGILERRRERRRSGS